MTKTEREATQSELREKILELVKKYNDIEIEKETEKPTHCPVRIGLQTMYARNPELLLPSHPKYEEALACASENYRFPDSTDTEVPDHGAFWQHSTQSC